jgi:glutamate formiminotransferase/formiminotetrahydrofolate cyclodeaminase
MLKLVECIPNFSEGRRREVVDAIVGAMEVVPGVQVLDREMDADHNRCVITILGEPASVKEAAFRACAKAAESIDMNQHRGEHPRIGGTDVIPFVPIAGVTIQECILLAKELGKEIADKLGIPVYLYEKAAARPERENLAAIREGQYEGLKTEIMTNPQRLPDFGPARMHPTAGATVVGARDPLIAFNVNLNTADLEVAKRIAKAVRFRDGGLRFVKANGFMIRERGIAQVSMNLVNYRGTPVHRVYEMVRREAERYGVGIVGSEIVGLVPLNALLDAAEYYLRIDGFKRDQVLESRLSGIVAPAPGSALPRGFLDEVASDSPAPGGGSVSALLGALGSALSGMVCRLTIGRKKFAAVSEELTRVLRDAERLREELTLLIAEDAAAFSNVMAASRLPRGTEQERERRSAAVEEATREAASVPLKVMRLSLRGLGLAQVVAEKGNPNSASDAGVSALALRAAAQGAHLNVLINLRSIEDSSFRERLATEARDIDAEALLLSERVLELVRAKIEG